MLKLVQRRRWAMCLAIVLTAPFLPRQPAAATICAGDCDGNGSVAINELIVGVNVALGSASLCDCSALDSDFDGGVAINDLVTAVNTALSGCPLTAVLHVSGTCARQPSSGGRRFEACDDCTAVRVYSCESRDGACLQRTPRVQPLAAVRVSGGKGGWALDIPGDAVSPRALLSFEAEVADGVIYRTLDLGPAGSSITVAATRGLAEVEDVLISPATEAAVRLIEDSGLQNFSDDEIAAVSTAVDAATAQIPFADLSASEAATQAEQTASQDPTVITIIENAVATPTPAATRTETPTATAVVPTDTATATETPSITPTASATFTPTSTPTPNCMTTIPGGLVADETWTRANSPYCVTGDLRTSLLTIEPGVQVLVDGPYEIQVLSTISAVGTAVAPIRFAAKDHAVRWKGFRFQNTQPGSSLTHCLIEQAERSALTLIDAAGFTISNCTFRGNGTAGNGAAIDAIGVVGDLNIIDSRFENNSASVHGGALHVKMVSGSTLRITRSIFDNNVANPDNALGDYVGGAVYLEDGDAVITRSRFFGNRSNSRCQSSGNVCRPIARGGAMYIAGSGNILIEQSEFIGNQVYAINQGAACHISDLLGSAIFINSGTVKIVNAVLSCNEALLSGCLVNASGAGLYLEGGTVDLVNSTIARNPNSGGIGRVGGSLSVTNSIVYSNNADRTQIDGTVTVTFSDVQGVAGMDGPGNINFDPVFASTGCAPDDLRLVPGSPCIDAGNPDSAFNDGCFPPSVATARNDMGAFGGPGACAFVEP